MLGMDSSRVVRLYVDEVRQDEPLTAEEVRGDGDAQRKLHHAADVELPLRVDPDGAAAGRTASLDVRSAGVASALEVVRIDDRTGADVLPPVVVGEARAQAPAVREPLDDLQLDAVVALRIVRPVLDHDAGAGRRTRRQAVVRLVKLRVKPFAPSTVPIALPTYW